MVSYPTPDTKFPVPGTDRLVYLKTVVTHPAIEVGDYSYYDAPEDAAGFERNVIHHYPDDKDRLIIGRFCQIAKGVIFMMNSANHPMRGFSTYPFAAFGGDWAGRYDGELDSPDKGDIVIGNDVWLGHEAMILPGVSIGDGAIIGARSIVSRDVPPYSIVAGNPARVTSQRFDDETVAALLEIRWWDWDIERITRFLPPIGGAEIEALRDAAIAEL